MSISGDVGMVLEPASELVHRLRMGAGMSQRELAKRLAEASGCDAVDREQVSRWERGNRIPNQYWQSWLADVLRVSEDDLRQAAAVSRLIRVTPGSQLIVSIVDNDEL